jgi:uncharacterized NAD(P)/FAD-binding protein YdhS
MTRSVAIFGAGFSGTLTALHLLARRGGPSVHLIERGEGFGRGLAYGAGGGDHLLNVRAGNMSAYPDRPGHLLDWLEAQGLDADPAGFIGRGVYGRYLQSQLRAAVTGPAAAGRLDLVRDEAVAMRRHAGRFEIRLAMGRTLAADAAVLAVGAGAPRRPDVLTDAAYVGDPWGPGALGRIEPHQNVVILGAGLTMVDVAHALIAQGHRAPIVALSRRGLSPHRHHGPPGPAGPVPAPDSLSRRLWTFRRRAESDWRNAFDGLRAHTTALWRDLSPDERGRFLRHLRPYWEAHRHRLAPAVAGHLDGWIASGALTIAAGRLETADRHAVTWRVRGETVKRRLSEAVLINCSGPDADVTAAPSPLIADLLSSGWARPDALRLGLDTTPGGNLIGAAGAVQDDLFAIGPLTRPALWEATAAPDLRNHACDLAAALDRASRAAA